MAAAQEKKLEKKRRIIESAYQLFQSKNIYNTAVDDIVKAAGIARGTFYLYFKDKSDLIEQLLFFKSAESMKAIMKQATETAEPVTDIRAYSRALISMYIDFLVGQKETLALVDKNISACMRFFPEFYDEEAQKLYTGIVNTFAAFGYPETELTKKIYLIVGMIGNACADAIAYGRPYSIEEIREPLTRAALSILEDAAEEEQNEKNIA